jgi:hypothetical protein
MHQEKIIVETIFWKVFIMVAFMNKKHSSDRIHEEEEFHSGCVYELKVFL